MHTEVGAETLRLRTERDQCVAWCAPDSFPDPIREQRSRRGNGCVAGGQQSELARGRDSIPGARDLLVSAAAVRDHSSRDRHQAGDREVDAVEQPELEWREAQLEDEVDRQHRVDHLRRHVGEHARQTEIDDLRGHPTAALLVIRMGGRRGIEHGARSHRRVHHAAATSHSCGTASGGGTAIPAWILRLEAAATREPQGPLGVVRHPRGPFMPYQSGGDERQIPFATKPRPKPGPVGKQVLGGTSQRNPESFRSPLGRETRAASKGTPHPPT
jgi:hypothetical protein